MQAVIFDMDGVLIDSMQYHVQAWDKCLKKAGLQLTQEELALSEGTSFRNTIRLAAKKAGKELTHEQVEEIYAYKKPIMDEIFTTKVYEEIPNILTFLKKNNIKIALVTGSNKLFTTNVVEKNFQNMFDVVITHEDVTVGKPEPEPFLKAQEKLNVNTKDIIVVENSPNGIISAKKANLFTIALKTTLAEKHLKDADLLFENHEQLFNYLQEKV